MNFLWIALAIGGVILLARKMDAAIASAPPVEPVTPATPDPGAPVSPFSSPGIADFAAAIATAEGFFVDGSAPQRAHNPGALKIPNWTGPTTGTEAISVFADDDEGWRRLDSQLVLIASGASRVYTPTQTIAEMARTWTDTAGEAWAANVVSVLNARGYGVSVDTMIGQVLG